MFIHVIVDNDGGEVVSIKEVKQEDVLAALASTPDGNVSYILNDFCGNGRPAGACSYISELLSYDYDEVVEQLFMSEEEGALVAKFDNDILE